MYELSDIYTVSVFLQSAHKKLPSKALINSKWVFQASSSLPVLNTTQNSPKSPQLKRCSPRKSLAMSFLVYWLHPVKCADGDGFAAFLISVGGDGIVDFE